MGDTGDSGDFVFRADNYVGDFEGLYRAMSDPWGQSGEHPRMRDYYRSSREALVRFLRVLDTPGAGWTGVLRALEVGCGIGHVTDQLRTSFPNRTVHGCDISQAAVERAWATHPSSFFFQLDITASDAVLDHHWYASHYNVVVLNQILWYILERLPTAFDNCARLLVPHGHLIIHTAFLDDQKFGKGTVDGFHGLIGWVLAHAPGWQIVGASYDPTPRHAPYHDGALVLGRTI